MEANLRQMLRHRVWIERPEVALELGNPTSPRYVRESVSHRALVQPLSGQLRSGLMGALAESTHVVYLGESVEPGVVVVHEVKRYQVLACENEGGQGHHWRAVVREIAPSE